MIWVEDEKVGPPCHPNYTRIWRDDENGWQINYDTSQSGRKYLLLDVSQPWWLPASSSRGHFSTLEQAQEFAAKEGPTQPAWDTPEVRKLGVRYGILNEDGTHKD